MTSIQADLILRTLLSLRGYEVAVAISNGIASPPNRRFAMTI